MRMDARTLCVDGRTFYNNQGIWEPVDRLPVRHGEILTIFDFLREEILINESFFTKHLHSLLSEFGTVIVKENE